jgi:DNA-binding HxlR family transcriptional regulator
MDEEPKDIIVLGAIKKGAKKFSKIRDKTGIDPEELNKILEKLEQRGFIRVEKKKGFLGGEKIELNLTDKGANELEQRVHEMGQKWDRMVQLYKSGDKKQLQEYMDQNRMDFPMMMFFGIMNMMMYRQTKFHRGQKTSLPIQEMLEATPGETLVAMADSTSTLVFKNSIRIKH